MRNAVKFFVENYKLTLILSGFLLIYGMQGLQKMNAEKYPAVSLATAVVVTSYRGASAEDIETKITKPIEDEIKAVVGIKDISSVSMSGLSNITVRVDMDNYNVAEVMDEIQKKVEGTPGLPLDLQDKPKFTEINSEELPVYEIAMLGSNKGRERDLAAEELQEILEDISSVKEVQLAGHGKREFNIYLDPKKMQRYFISVGEVLNKVGARNVNIPGGNLKEGNDEALIRVEGKIKNAEDLKNFMIRSNFSGQKVYLRDIATIVDGEEEKRILTRFNGQPSTLLTVIKKAGEDTLKLVDEIKKRVASFKEENPHEGITLGIALDDSIEVQGKMDVLASNAVTGLVLVIFFLFIFLPWKVAGPTSLSLPLAVMATLGVMPMFGMNLDSITVLALIIALGMLVDNSVVISETYVRNMERGMEPEKAAEEAVSELWGPITASAFTTIAAFLPMLVTKGVMGAFISSIPIVVTASLLFSLGESFFLLPMRLTKMAKNIKKKTEDTKPGLFARFEKLFGAFMALCLKYRYVVALGFFAVLGVSLYFLGVKNKFILFPAEQTEIYVARFEAPKGTTAKRTDELAGILSGQIAEILKGKLDYIRSEVGQQRTDLADIKGGDGANLGLITINVNDDTKLNVNYTEVLAMLKKVKAPYLEKLSFEEVINGPPVGSAIQARFRSNDKERLNRMINLVLEDMKKVEGVEDIKIDDVIGEDEVFVNIDFVKADRVNLTTKEIGDTIRTAVSGTPISQVTLANKDVDLKIQFDKKYRKNLKDLYGLKIPNSRGNLISLSKVAEFKRVQGAPQIKRYKNRLARTITGNVDISKITSEKANALLQESFEKHRKDVKGVSLFKIGAAESSAESMESLGQAFNLAILGIFGLLVFIFNSFMKPFIILTTIPLGLLGFSIAFYFHDRPVSFLALIGVIGLAGIIVNAGIVLISYIDDLIRSGKPVKQALVEASVTRFRPVLVTSLTTISGLFPTAYSVGGSDPMLIPMTLAMAWGLTTGTVLTLIWVPCACGILEDLTALGRKIGDKFTGETKTKY